MPDCSTQSAPVLQLEIRASRRLWLWWFGLHGLLAAAIFMVSPWVGFAVLPALLLHAVKRRPANLAGRLTAGRGRFALPDEGRHDLLLMAGSRAGPGWMLLVFDDRPDRPRVLLSDQLEAPDWRILRLALSERR